MPRKVTYVEDNLHVNPFKVLINAVRKLDRQRPIIVVGIEKGTGHLFVASTDSGQPTNSLLAKAMNFLKVS